MKLHKVVKNDGAEVVRGSITLTKNCWLQVSYINSVLDCVYAFSDEPSSLLGIATESGKNWAESPVDVTITAKASGHWNNPDGWWLEVANVTIKQGNNTLYDGPIVRGYSGNVLAETGMFTSMSFIQYFFREELDAILEEEIDEWIML